MDYLLEIFGGRNELAEFVVELSEDRIKWRFMIAIVT